MLCLSFHSYSKLILIKGHLPTSIKCPSLGWINGLGRLPTQPSAGERLKTPQFTMVDSSRAKLTTNNSCFFRETVMFR